MDALAQALKGAAHEPPPAAPLQALGTAIVVGAAGVLGSAVLAEALVAGRFQQVTAAVTGPLKSTLRGLRTQPAEALWRGTPSGADTAFVVFERERHANGRDEAFLRPAPEQLPALAAALRQAGVRRLLVLVPHAPALLPQALKGGFASQLEANVAALGFEQLIFVRAAQAGGAAASGPLLERLAAWWLSQLSWMVPQREQPLRAITLAQLMVQLARQLPLAPPGTRVLAPELLWQAAQAADPLAVLNGWLQHSSA